MLRVGAGAVSLYAGFSLDVSMGECGGIDSATHHPKQT